MPSASSVDDDKINGAELTSLGAIIELHPEQTDVVPKTFEGCPVHTELEIEGLKRIRLVTRRENLKRGCNVEKRTGRQPDDALKYGSLRSPKSLPNHIPHSGTQRSACPLKDLRAWPQAQ